MFNADIKDEIHKLLNNPEEIKSLLKNSEVFLKRYLVNYGSSAEILIKNIINMKKSETK